MLVNILLQLKDVEDENGGEKRGGGEREGEGERGGTYFFWKKIVLLSVSENLKIPNNEIKTF